jgi:hypothetical protein
MLALEEEVGQLEVGKPATFIEVECREDLSSVSCDDAVLGGLLGTSRKELNEFMGRAACREALDALAHRGLDIGPQLNCLSDEIAATQRHLDDKVQRVTIGGKLAFAR